MAIRARLAPASFALVTRRAWMPFRTIALWIASVVHGMNDLSYRHVVGYALDPVLTAVAILQLVAHSGSRAWRWLDWRPVAWTGKVSYSVYLYQQIGVFGIARFVGPHWSVAVRLAVSLAVTFTLAAASHYLVERPFLRFKGRGAARSERRPGTLDAAG